MGHKARECMHCKGVMVHTSTKTINFIFSADTFTCAGCRKKVTIDGYLAFGLWISAGLLLYAAALAPYKILCASVCWGFAARSAYMHRKSPRIGTVEAEITRVVRR
jgi:hypothetical protein